MATYGRLEKWFTDASGNALANLTVEVRKQGAWADGSSGGGDATAFTTHNSGAIKNGDDVVIGTGTAERSATVTNKTAITLSGAGHTWIDGDRLSPTTNLPTIYSDGEGVDSIANPLTTDSRGRIECYVRGGFYDLRINGTGYTTTIISDVFIAGEHMRSMEPNSVATVAWVFDTFNSIASTGAKLISVRTIGVEKFFIDKDGGFSADGDSSIDGALTFDPAVSKIIPGATSLSLRNNADGADNLIITDAGAVTIRAGLTVTASGITIIAGDLTMGDTASQIVPGATSFAVRNNADSANNLLVSDAGDISARLDFFGRRPYGNIGTALVAGDFSDVSGMDTGSYAPVSGSRDQQGQVDVTLGASPTARPTFRLTFTDGNLSGGVPPYVVATGYNASNNTGVHIQIAARAVGSVDFEIVEASPTGAHVYNIRWVAIGTSS